ncbi:MAG: hypothetical protein EXS37_12180 [Opitutus sp.]|nr:hypothetical protein [Opitutus sp.]
MGRKPPISFSTWKIALSQAGLTDAVQRSHEREILSFLHLCNLAHTAVTIALARHDVTRPRPGDTPARETLRWLVRAS